MEVTDDQEEEKIHAKPTPDVVAATFAAAQAEHNKSIPVSIDTAELEKELDLVSFHPFFIPRK